MRSLLIMTTAALVSGAACAPMPVDGGSETEVGRARACFIPSGVRNFRTDTQGAVYLRTSRDEVFALRTACGDLDPAWRLALISDNGVTTCVGDRVILAAGGSVVPPSAARCSAFVDRRLTAEEVAALPDRSRP